MNVWLEVSICVDIIDHIDVYIYYNVMKEIDFDLQLSTASTLIESQIKEDFQ